MNGVWRRDWYIIDDHHGSVQQALAIQYRKSFWDRHPGFGNSPSGILDVRRIKKYAYIYTSYKSRGLGYWYKSLGGNEK
jgi:hypothetical protein